MTVTVVASSTALGLVIGSFLNVVICRVPEGESIVRPGSRCPRCQTPIAPRDNVPVLSWLLLRGRCRACNEPIPARYPIVEALTGVLFGAVAGRTGLQPELPAYLVFVAALLALAVIDLDRYILPRRIIYVTAAICGTFLVGAAMVDGLNHLATAAIGAAAGFGLLLIIHVVSPRGMGFGDVRLAGLIGLVTGFAGVDKVLLALFGSFVLASVGGLSLMAARLRSRKDRIPFGPFLALSAVIVLLFGVQLSAAYAGFFGR